jgi:hypothetical protein
MAVFAVFLSQRSQRFGEEQAQRGVEPVATKDHQKSI